ncbi:MAG: heme A synthase [Flavobacteriales bacterium]|nr:MAG: heme A synthase [Flavobacteriales bacterium]
MRKLLLRLLRIELVLAYLVIVAGSVVRMSGSGMGCPDWPKCFGLLIPPTSDEQVQFYPDVDYQKGQMIIVNDTLWKAKSSFHSQQQWDKADWEAYTKHDYTVFNATHTWIEYINRLLGALAGLPMLLIFFVGLTYIRKFPLISLLGFASLFMIGFVAWLGKLVVDGNLIPGSITIHMLGAMIIIALLFTMMALLQNKVSSYVFDDKRLSGWLSLALILTIVQIIMGTQVREEIDHLYKAYQGGMRELWIDQLGITFYVHRSFSILLLLVNAYLWNKNRQLEQPVRLYNFIMSLLMLELISGIVLAYLDVPAAAQPIHLVLAILIFGFQYFLWIHNQILRVKDPESEKFLLRRFVTSQMPALQSSMNQSESAQSQKN